MGKKSAILFITQKKCCFAKWIALGFKLHFKHRRFYCKKDVVRSINFLRLATNNWTTTFNGSSVLVWTTWNAKCKLKMFFSQPSTFIIIQVVTFLQAAYDFRAGHHLLAKNGLCNSHRRLAGNRIFNTPSMK